MEQNKIIIYQTEDGHTQVDVRLENDTVWLTQAQMAELFGTDRTTIVRHINNIFKEGELQKEEVSAKFAHTTRHGAMGHFGKFQQSRALMLLARTNVRNWKRGCLWKQARHPRHHLSD